MAKGNYSTLDMNIMHGLDCEEACAMFLRLRDRCGSLEAEQAAYEWRDVGRIVSVMLDLTRKVHKDSGLKTDIHDGVFEFIRERQYRRYAPGN